MHITCVSFGIGAILVNIAAKKIFEDKEKFYPIFDFNFNESNDDTQYNPVFALATGFTSKLERSETQRLLDDSTSSL